MSTAICLQACCATVAEPQSRVRPAPLRTADVAAGRSRVGAVPGVHFARWLVVPGDATLAGGPVPDTLVYTADVDGSAPGTCASWTGSPAALLDQLFGHCGDYPASPDARADGLAARAPGGERGVVREHRRSATVDRIVAEARLQRLAAASARPAPGGAEPSAAGRDPPPTPGALAGDQAMAFALEPAAGEPLTDRVRRVAHRGGGGDHHARLLPLLIVIGLPWLLALRRLERRDPTVTGATRPQPGRPAAQPGGRVRPQPVRGAGRVKPGRLRATTVNVVLLAIAFAARASSTEDRSPA